MPYSNVPEDKTEAMHSCVEQVMAKHEGEEGFTKENAIKICYNQIVGSMDVDIGSAEVHFEIVTDPSEVNMVLGQEFKPGELLRWRNAELARAEVNANMDELDNENIDMLAGTLPLMPLTIEHDNEIVGLFTAASAQPVPGHPESHRLLTDGIMYARRFPEIADDIRNGRRRLSVEAFAEKAICSLCGGVFPDAREYCEHLQNRHTTGVSRKFKGLRAVGGGVVRRPAGSSAGFDSRQVYMVASHQETVTTGESDAAPESDVVTSGVQEAQPEGDNMELEQVQEQLNKALADLEVARAERDKIAEERDGFSARVIELEASVTEITAKLEEAKKEREQVEADLKWKERSGLLSSVFDAEELERQKPVVMAMSDEAVSLLVEAAKQKSEQPPPTGTLTANLGDDDDKVVVSLA